MADSQFKMAYHNEGHAFVLSNGSMGNATSNKLGSFDVHKRSVSSKKIKASKKNKQKSGGSNASQAQVGYPATGQSTNYRQVYQKLPTQGYVNSLHQAAAINS